MHKLGAEARVKCDVENAELMEQVYTDDVFSTFLITCCNMAGSNNNRHVSTDEETKMLLGLIHKKKI